MRCVGQRTVFLVCSGRSELDGGRGGKIEEQMLAKLEEKVLKLKETISSVLAAQSLELEKLANVAQFLTGAASEHMG